MRRKKKVRYRQRQIILAGSLVLLIAALSILLISVLVQKNHDRESAVSESLVTVQPDTEEITAPEAEKQPAENTGDVAEGKLQAAPSPEESAAETQIGALEDTQDPQNSGTSGNEAGTGAEVTVEKLSADETAGITLGIDVSKYQGTIDWPKVKESGVEFAMIRVGYRAKSTGELFEDPAARYNLQEAQAAGIKLGAYFFSSAVTEAEAKE